MIVLAPLPLATLLLILMLTGCGWHLRGAGTDNSPLTAITLSAEDSYTPLYRTVKQEYEQRHIALNQPATVHIHLINEMSLNKGTALTSQLHTAEEEVVMVVHYQIFANGATDTTVRTAQVTRQYTLNQARAAANDIEKQTTLTEMRREIARQLLLQAELLQRQPTTPPTP